MAGERTLPNMGLSAFWDLGDNTYKAEMDKNLLVLSVMAQGAIASRLASAPGSPTNGDVHVATTDWGATLSAADVVVIRDDDAWVEVAPQEGWRVYDQATDELLTFDGSAWQSPAAGGASGLTIVTDSATDRVVSSGDLDGNTLIQRSNASAQTVTVNSGLTGTEPVTIVPTGAGTLTIVAGASVTINSAGGLLDVSAQYASVTLIPQGSDSYLLIGALV